MWNVEITDEFFDWWRSLSDSQQDALQVGIELLENNGPSLGRPHADTVKGSRHPNMKELRTQCAGKPLRTFFAFDPRRSAILLIGGDKTGDKRFYDRMIPLADALYDVYLDELRKEGLI
ncbi:MAG TPA: type II toxin-antitoxin system RelE/ParE family toxin [Phycisphaerae bacterium]|nr:type II toxin-antitoxin system RelE/ParE family toxin [Phycisphaerae bacterium]